MKSFIIATTLLICGFAQADYLPAPVITCGPSQVFDAGYSLSVDATDDGYIGRLSQGSYGGPKPLGSEKINVRAIRANGRCKLVITQKNDVDNNDLLITIQAGRAGSGNRGHMQMKLNGRPINDLFSDLNCYINQYTYNELCQPDYSGAIYENSSGRSK